MKDFLIPQSITPQQAATLQEQYEAVIEIDPVQASQVWESLHIYFLNNTAEKEIYKHTYYVWYVDLTWRFFMSVSEEDVAGVVASQYHLAPILGIDVWKKIMMYLNQPIFDTEDRERIYQKIRNAALQSEAPFPSFIEGKAMRIKDIIEKIKFVENTASGNTLKEAELSGLMSGLYDKQASPVTSALYTDTIPAVHQLLVVIHFFLGVKADGINLIIDDYFLKKPFLESPFTLPELEQIASGEASLPEYTEEDDTEDTPSFSLSLKEEFDSAVSRFGKTVDANQVSEVLAYLDALATERGDEQIRDFLQYNEQTGTFEWNEDLLTSR